MGEDLHRNAKGLPGIGPEWGKSRVFSGQEVSQIGTERAFQVLYELAVETDREGQVGFVWVRLLGGQKAISFS
jgi:hypothetical protein